MTLIKRTADASHWYLKDGTPFHEVQKKDGGGNRPTTLADARKVGALPSVTNINGIIAKPSLDNYKQEQNIVAALTLPRIDGESLDAFAQRVVGDSRAHMESAMKLGTAVHARIEHYLEGDAVPCDLGIDALCEPAFKWIDANVKSVVSTEGIVVGNGYAGRVDLVATMIDGGIAVIDFKTQSVKKARANFYPEFPLQLEAYARAIENATRTISVVISNSTVEPGVWSKEWTDHDGAWKAFDSAFTLWKYIKGYDPEKEVA